MRNQIETRQAERAIAAIEQLDLEPVKFKISSAEDGYGWTREHAERIALAYRRFLMLLARHPGLRLAPTRDIDKFWHAHILDTHKYASDCERIFGQFLHHDPYLGMRGDKDKLDEAASTLAVLFEREFGEVLPSNAPAGAAAGGDKASAWCGGEIRSDRSAAWCGGEVGGDKSAAWCGGEVDTNAGPGLFEQASLPRHSH